MPVLRTVVTAILPGSQAEDVGMRVGDVVAAIGRESVLGRRGTGLRLQEVDAGVPIPLTLRRRDDDVHVSVMRPQPGFLGIAYGDLTSEDRDRLGLHDDEGVVVERVLPGGPAADAGLQPGDIILRIADRPARHRSLARRVQAIGASNTLDMHILRDGRTLQRQVQLGQGPATG
jgi:S1-C subfamily serine protease